MVMSEAVASQCHGSGVCTAAPNVRHSARYREWSSLATIQSAITTITLATFTRSFLLFSAHFTHTVLTMFHSKFD